MWSSVLNRVNTENYRQAVDELRRNSEQWAVYESRNHCVVLAGPGSGKTKTLTVKLARMLFEDIHPPRGIACLTYSSECARELTRRLESLGVVATNNLFIGTVHSFCLKNILLPYHRMAGLQIPDPLKVANLAQQRECWNIALDEVFPGKHPSQTEIDHYRRTYVDRRSEEWKSYNEAVAYAIEQYEKQLRCRGLVDFDDMVLYGLSLVVQYPWIRKILRARFPILAVDEYQDLGLSLHSIVMYLCFKAGVRLLAVGDPDQSIYGFVGAQPSLLRDLARRPDVETTQLRLNYRCGTKIVRASEGVLGKSRGTFDTPPDAPIGTIDFREVTAGLSEQARVICEEIIPQSLPRRVGRCLGDVAVLYFDRSDGNIVAAAAERAGLNYVRIDKNAPYPKTPLTRWLEDCAKWCSGGWSNGQPRLSELIKNWLNFNRGWLLSDDTQRQTKRILVRFLWGNRSGLLSLEEWLNTFYEVCLRSTFYEGCEQSDEFEALSQLMSESSGGGRLEKYTVAQFASQGGSPNHLNLITLHSAKGLEYDVVVLFGMDQGHFPWRNDSLSTKAEKRRLFYVGVTRARHEVHITYSGWYTDKYRGRQNLGPSEFVVNLRKKLSVE